MASVINDPKGRKRIQFTDSNGKRQTLWMGRMDKKAANAAKVRVEALVACQKIKHVPDNETARWVGSLDDTMHAKLAGVGLVLGRDSTVLGRWLETQVSRATLKPASVRKLRDTMGKLTKYFGSDVNVRTVTPDLAAKWRESLTTLGEASRRTHTGNAKGLFSPLVDRKILEDNPFTALASGPTASKGDRYITPADTQAVLDACPDWRYRAIFGLARLAGLRVRSEGMDLLWRDVHFDTGRMLIRSPKTERFEGHELRMVPIFPALDKILREALEGAEDGAERVIPLRWTGTIPERMLATVKAAGVKPWPKLFQALRSSCEKEWAMAFPQYVVSKWIGHSIVISGKHYVNDVPEEMFQLAARNTAQQGAELTGSYGKVSSATGRVENRKPAQLHALPVGAGRPHLGDEGLEQPSTSSKHRKIIELSKNSARNTSRSKTNTQSRGNSDARAICPTCHRPL